MGHLKAIQEKVPFPLWVGIPHIVDNLPIPVGLGVYVDDMKSELESKHHYKADRYFFGGHSLGGSSVGSWAHSNIDQVEGVFLWGSYVASSVGDPATNYGAPVLTVGAELDGWMARITRIAESYDQMKSSPVGYESTKYSHPVVLIPGMNHASFLSGTPPPAVQETDLRASITMEQAIDRVSDASAAFLTITRRGLGTDSGKLAKAVIDEMIDYQTAPMLEPVLEFSALEGAPFMSSFKNTTPWVAIGQDYVAGDILEDKKLHEKELKFVDEYKTFVAIEGEFSHAKPKIKAEDADSSTTDVLSFSHSAYNWRTSSWIDAADYYCATEVGAKFKSREAIYKHFGVRFKVPEATCKGINEMARDFVLKNFNGSQSVLDRFEKHGQPIEFLEDTSSGSGITWCNEAIITKNTTTTYQVSSRALLSPVDFIVPEAAGMLYCKLMSPARILEWMLVDGLKQNLYWAPNPPKEEGEVSLTQ